MWLEKLKLTVAAMLSYCASPHARFPADGTLRWHFGPMVIAGLTAVAALYALGLYRLSKSADRADGPDWAHIVCFVCGMLALVVALCSPVATLADALFSMHMAQHILLMMVAPPLLVWSRPGPILFAAFNTRWRGLLARSWKAAGLDRVGRILMHPVSVFVLFCGAFIFWHLPLPYLWGLSYETAHLLEQASFLFTALAFWTLIIEPSGERRLGYAAALLYLAVTVIVSDMPGALMVLAPRPLYPIHAEGAAAYGMTLMQDQQLAGLIMWIPAGAIYIAAAIWLFVRLLAESERRSFRVRRAAPLAAVAVLLPLLLIGCRDHARGAESEGDPEQGRALIGKVGCGTCHTIPGFDGANGLVGPPLDHMASRVYIAGVLRNTPDDMVTWLRNPQSVVPGNAMPNFGLSEEQARDIAAYLYTLK